ncbi:hypothetical protein GR212_31205 [Rhizobium lusitanum]|uniref:Uncharacterized protein n=1 Tax=Rhizobium lusitanum TaxID=293958 RepID=A0A6L9UJF7_9HYPH|nr:hypothetical protein [Rhizobium lusitanum]NEI74030.1 hypothetical protein [Rhizobium lusitanum]
MKLVTSSCHVELTPVVTTPEAYIEAGSLFEWRPYPAIAIAKQHMSLLKIASDLGDDVFIRWSDR